MPILYICEKPEWTSLILNGTLILSHRQKIPALESNVITTILFFNKNLCICRSQTRELRIFSGNLKDRKNSFLSYKLIKTSYFTQDLQTSKTEESMVHENVEHMRQILVNHQRKLDTMANGMETIQVYKYSYSSQNSAPWLAKFYIESKSINWLHKFKF